MDDDFGEYLDDSIAASPVMGDARPPAVIADRYELGTLLGAGGHGTVYRAVDRLMGRDVALKLLRADADRTRLRREAVALRSLRIPGVVHLLDDGLHGDWPFLVMDLVEGRPLGASASSAPIDWSELRAPAASLFEVIGRVHEAGVLHLDLKPANLRVSADGSVVLLDLGLAGGPALGGAAPARCTGGTLRYMAPEQAASGRVDARSDLYAAGVMLHEALTGQLPGAAPADELDAHVPPRVRATLRALVQRDPDRRPASAWETLDRLGIQPRAAAAGFVPAGTGPFPSRDLEAIFQGPERILHLRSDPAAMLHQRTDGARDRVAAELDRWIRLGVAVPEGTHLRVDRASLDWLEISAASAAELAALAIDGQWNAVAARAEQDARDQLERGRPDRARLAIEQGLFAAQRGQPDREDREDREERGGRGDTGAESRLLALWAQMAIDRYDALELQLALYRVGRAHRRTDELAALESLLRASLHAEQREMSRAAELIATLAPFADPELELRRHAVQLRVAAQQSPADEEAALDQALAWARGQSAARVRSRVLGWVGRLRYRQGRFDDAALLHEQAVASAILPVERLSSQLNAASALMEVGRYSAARAFARDALAETRRCRAPLHEGRAEWLLRAIAYRAGELDHPDRELVDAAEYLAMPSLTAVIALNEAAVAWRAGSLDVARTLVAKAATNFDAASIRGGRQTVQALELACRDGLAGPHRRLDSTDPAPVASDEIDALARDTLADPVVDIDWQVLGLLSLLRGGETWRDEAVRRARAAPHPRRRRELLAPFEVLDR